MILLGRLVLLALSVLIWLMENRVLLIQACQLQELFAGFIDSYTGAVNGDTWDGAGNGEEAASCFGALSAQTWKEDRQQE